MHECIDEKVKSPKLRHVNKRKKRALKNRVRTDYSINICVGPSR